MSPAEQPASPPPPHTSTSTLPRSCVRKGETPYESSWRTAQRHVKATHKGQLLFRLNADFEELICEPNF